MPDEPRRTYEEAVAALGFNTGNVGTLRGQFMWNGQPIIDDDDGGTAGVREPRRPGPKPLAPMSMAREVEPEFCVA